MKTEQNFKIRLDTIVYDDEKMKILIKEVIRKISEERKKRGLSMNQLAELSNLTGSYIYKLENMQCEIGLKTLLKISSAFGIKPEELLPIEVKNRVLTNGERFEQIVQGADVRTINFLLQQAEELIKYERKRGNARISDNF